MGKIQSRILVSLIIISCALILGACSPDPDPKIPTNTIVITNIPARIINSKVDDDGEKPLWKVYVQLSVGMTATAGAVAEGRHTLVSSDFSTDGKTATVTIPLHEAAVPPDAPYSGELFSGTGWANIALVISPENVTNIFDVDARVSRSGPSSSSETVTFDWKRMWDKKMMTITDYRHLYGSGDGDGEYIGVVAGDPDRSPKPPYADDSPTSDWYTWALFLNKN